MNKQSILKLGSSGSRLQSALEAGRRLIFQPKSRLTVTEWAEKYMRLSPETSSTIGPFTAFPYQRGIMDAINDPTVRQITMQKSARVGYTKCLDAILGYFIHQDPAPVLIVQPREIDSEDYSRSEIAPMLRDSPVLAALTGELKGRDSDQRIAKRTFKNGSSLSFVGASSPSGFRRITARIVALDEVDGFPTAGMGANEGDQVDLAIKRTESFWNRKIIAGSTPTVKGVSRIEKLYAESDMRKYHVPCPGCGVMQTLKFANLQWDKDALGNHLPETAHFVCEVHGCIIEEKDKPMMIEAGEWISERPFTGHAGFHIWAAYSLFYNARWPNLVREHLRVGRDPVLRRTYTNLVLGECWDEDRQVLDGESLLTRSENYSPQTLPIAIRFITAGVDTQGDRLEVQIIGWGVGEECWVISYSILYGDPGGRDVWMELDSLLRSRFTNEHGYELRIRAACVDSGGHHSAEVQQFCRLRRGRKIFAIKGGITGDIWPVRSSGTKSHDKVFMVNVNKAKESIYDRLRNAVPGPGHVHFPASDWFDAEYVAQLTSEQLVTKYRAGRAHREWVLPSGKNNEALDTFVYAFAASRAAPMGKDTQLLAQTLPTPPQPKTDVPGPRIVVQQPKRQDGDIKERAARWAAKFSNWG